MSEIHEEDNSTQNEKQLNIESEGIDCFYFSIKESTAISPQETETIPAPNGPPPIPKRWSGTSFPKAYSLGLNSRNSRLVVIITHRSGLRI